MGWSQPKALSTVLPEAQVRRESVFFQPCQWLTLSVMVSSPCVMSLKYLDTLVAGDSLLPTLCL